MNDKFNQWFAQVDGKPIESEDPTNLDQCFDLAFNWCDFLNIPRDSIRHFRAYQIFTDPNPDTTDFWEMIANTPTGVPQVGDLIIWGTQVGVSGHVAIFKEGDSSQFTSEDQNWAGLQKAHLTKHSYNGVIGWLRAKNQQVDNSAVIAQPIAQSNTYTDQTLIPLGEFGEMEVQAIRGKLIDLRTCQSNPGGGFEPKTLWGKLWLSLAIRAG